MNPPVQQADTALINKYAAAIWPTHATARPGYSEMMAHLCHPPCKFSRLRCYLCEGQSMHFQFWSCRWIGFLFTNNVSLFCPQNTAEPGCQPFYQFLIYYPCGLCLEHKFQLSPRSHCVLIKPSCVTNIFFFFGSVLVTHGLKCHPYLKNVSHWRQMVSPGFSLEWPYYGSRKPIYLGVTWGHH